MSLMDLLQQAVSGSLGGQHQDQHLDQIVQQSSPDLLGKGLSEAFRSDKTPAFGDMVGQLFGQSNSNQQAGVLNQLLASAGPAILASIAGGALSKMMSKGSSGGLSAEQASQLSPAQVKDIAVTAEQHSPGVIDQIGRFYADHPGLVKTVGSTALLIAAAKMQKSLTRPN